MLALLVIGGTRCRGSTRSGRSARTGKPSLPTGGRLLNRECRQDHRRTTRARRCLAGVSAERADHGCSPRYSASINMVHSQAMPLAGSASLKAFEECLHDRGPVGFSRCRRPSNLPSETGMLHLALLPDAGGGPCRSYWRCAGEFYKLC